MRDLAERSHTVIFSVNERLEAPAFVDLPESLEVVEGKDASFLCTAKGKPVPEISWSQAGIPVQSDKHITIKEKPDNSKLSNQSELKIKSVVADQHEGEYDVSIKNSAGTLTHTVELIGKC
jgi:neural cell adhesion molecule